MKIRKAISPETKWLSSFSEGTLGNIKSQLSMSQLLRSRSSPMANPEHLALLEQSTALWNEWREKHPELQPDLRKASLQGMQLEGVNLAGADLRETIFSEANLSKANLNQANCHSADHRKANLSACTTNDEFTKMGCSQQQSLLNCTKS